MSPALDRSQLVPVVVGILVILAVGIAGASLQTMEPIGADDDQVLFDPPTAGEEVGGDGGIDDDPNATEEGEVMEEEGYGAITTCIDFLDSSLGVLLTIFGFLAAMSLVYLRFNFAITVLVGWTVFPPLMLAYFLVTDCSINGQDFGAPGEAPRIASDAGEAIVPASEIPTSIMVLLVGTVLIGALVLLYRSATAEELAIPEQSEEEEEIDLDSLARAAGRAADRIEEHDASVDNAVYRAWVEMTSMLDVDHPETYSAGEFAEEAIRLGMSQDDVGELTDLFNEVRYGGRDAAEREDRAIRVLRNIEETYEQQDPEDPDEASNESGEEADQSDDEVGE